MSPSSYHLSLLPPDQNVSTLICRRSFLAFTLPTRCSQACPSHQETALVRVLSDLNTAESRGPFSILTSSASLDAAPLGSEGSPRTRFFPASPQLLLSSFQLPDLTAECHGGSVSITALLCALTPPQPRGFHPWLLPSDQTLCVGTFTRVSNRHPTQHGRNLTPFASTSPHRRRSSSSQRRLLLFSQACEARNPSSSSITSLFLPLIHTEIAWVLFWFFFFFHFHCHFISLEHCNVPALVHALSTVASPVSPPS